MRLSDSQEKLLGGRDIGTGLCRIGRMLGGGTLRHQKEHKTGMTFLGVLVIAMELECLVQINKPKPPMKYLSSRDLLRGDLSPRQQVCFYHNL